MLAAWCTVTFAHFDLLPLFALSRLEFPYQPFALQFPTFTEYNINVASKLALGLDGFRIHRHRGRRNTFAGGTSAFGLISAPIIAVDVHSGHGSVVAFVPRDHIDVIGPIPQVLSIGFGSAGLGWQQ